MKTIEDAKIIEGILSLVDTDMLQSFVLIMQDKNRLEKAKALIGGKK